MGREQLARNTDNGTSNNVSVNDTTVTKTEEYKVRHHPYKLRRKPQKISFENDK